MSCGPSIAESDQAESESEQSVEEASVAAQGYAQVLGAGPLVVEPAFEVTALAGEQLLELGEHLTD